MGLHAWLQSLKNKRQEPVRIDDLRQIVRRARRKKYQPRRLSVDEYLRLLDGFRRTIKARSAPSPKPHGPHGKATHAHPHTSSPGLMQGIIDETTRRPGTRHNFHRALPISNEYREAIYRYQSGKLTKRQERQLRRKTPRSEQDILKKALRGRRGK